MTNFNERMLPVVRIEPTTVRIPGGRGSDRAAAPGLFNFVNAEWYIYQWISWSLVTYEMVYVPLSLAVVYIPLCYHNMPSPEWYIYQWMNWWLVISEMVYVTLLVYIPLFKLFILKPRVVYIAVNDLMGWWYPKWYIYHFCIDCKNGIYTILWMYSV